MAPARNPFFSVPLPSRHGRSVAPDSTPPSRPTGIYAASAPVGRVTSEGLSSPPDSLFDMFESPPPPPQPTRQQRIQLVRARIEKLPEHFAERKALLSGIPAELIKLQQEGEAERVVDRDRVFRGVHTVIEETLKEILMVQAEIEWAAIGKKELAALELEEIAAREMEEFLGE
jgi:hypothetical protein